MWERLTIVLLCFGFSFQSVASQETYKPPKFFLKSVTNPFIGEYYPIKISYEVDESSFKNPELNSTINAAADISLKALSDLILTSGINSGIKFGEKIQCDDFLIHQIIKSQGIDTDLGLYITFTNNFEDELIETKTCENNGQLLAISVTINSKKYITVEKTSQVKLLTSAITNIIFDDYFHRNELMSEVDEFLSSHSNEYFPKLAASGCNPPIPNCIECKTQTPSICFNCSASYMPNEDSTQCCAGQYCKTCNSQWLNCDSCIENYIFNNGGCRPCPTNCALCNTTACVECNPGFYVEEGTMCIWCTTGCETCHAGPESGSICTQCFDSAHSQLIDGQCSCIKANQVFNEDNICVCAPGYYEDLNEICQACNVGCEVCTSPSQCTTCFDKDYMIANADGSCKCKTNELTYNTTTDTCDCPRGFFPNETTALCDPCQDSCAWCFAYDVCVECVNTQILMPNGDGSCICMDFSKVYNSHLNACVPCPNGQYGYRGTCYTCDNPCSACSYFNNCTVCYDDMHLQYNTTSATYTCACDDAKEAYNPTTKTCGDCESKEGGCGGTCGEGCSVCNSLTSPATCQACYDSPNMQNINGVCSCIKPNQRFSISEKQCVDNSSAKGLALVWIMAIYAAI